MKGSQIAVLVLCITLALGGGFVGGFVSGRATAPQEIPDDMVAIPMGDTGQYAYVPSNMEVVAERMDRDTTEVSGRGGTFDSFREAGGEFEPGGPKSFDLLNGTLDQYATLFSFKQGGGALGQLIILGFCLIVAGGAAAIFTRNWRYLVLSGLGVGVILLGVFLQEFAGIIFVLCIGVIVIGFLFFTKAGSNLRTRLLRYVGAMGQAIHESPDAVKLAQATDRNAGDGLGPILEKQGLKVDIHGT